MTDFFRALLIACLITELLDLSQWASKRIVTWAARRWQERGGIDHTAEWLADVKARPTSALRLLSALWLALGAVVPPERLTLNLPSIWRLLRPFVRAGREMTDLAMSLARTRLPGMHRDRWLSQLHHLAVATAVSLLPKRQQERYREELHAELVHMPPRMRNYFCVSMLAGTAKLAIIARLAGVKP